MIIITVGEKIKEFRIKKGWSIGRLSQESGVSKSFISRLESNKKLNASISTLEKLAKPLGVTPKDLIVYTDLEKEFLENLETPEGFKVILESENMFSFSVKGEEVEVSKDDLMQAISLIKSLRSK